MIIFLYGIWSIKPENLSDTARKRRAFFMPYNIWCSLNLQLNILHKKVASYSKRPYICYVIKNDNNDN
jgi:hypothetical protein